MSNENEAGKRGKQSRLRRRYHLQRIGRRAGAICCNTRDCVQSHCRRLTTNSATVNLPRLQPPPNTPPCNPPLPPTGGRRRPRVLAAPPPRVGMDSPAPAILPPQKNSTWAHLQRLRRSSATLRHAGTRVTLVFPQAGTWISGCMEILMGVYK